MPDEPTKEARTLHLCGGPVCHICHPELAQPPIRCKCTVGTDDECHVQWISDGCPIHGKGINLPPATGEGR